MSKLTEQQIRVLRKLASAGPNTVWILGRITCEALRKRGLVHSSNGDDFPIHRYDGNPLISISDKGRAALSPPPIEGEVGTS